MKDFKYPKQNRLLKAAEFKAVFDKPIKKIHSEHFIAFVAKNGQDASSKLGLAITKKKIKQAVERNRIKRISREVFRLSEVKQQALSIVIIVKKNFIKDYDFRSEIEFIFKKIRSITTD